VPTVTITYSAAGQLQVILPAQAEEGGEAEEHAEEELDEGPSPIVPEGKELMWGAGAFIVLAILVRLVLFPKLKKGMDARHDLIQGELETAESTRAAAEAEVADYQAELAKVRAEAGGDGGGAGGETGADGGVGGLGVVGAETGLGEDGCCFHGDGVSCVWVSARDAWPYRCTRRPGS
jgi:hypothetical protein